MSNFLRIDGIRFKFKVGRAYTKEGYHPGDLNGRDFGWFLDKDCKNSEEFIAYLSSQIASELYVSSSEGQTPFTPYFFVGRNLRRLYRDAWSSQT